MQAGPEPKRASPCPQHPSTLGVNLIRAPHSKIRIISKTKKPHTCKSEPLTHQDRHVFSLSHLGPQASLWLRRSIRQNWHTKWVWSISFPSWNRLCHNSGTMPLLGGFQGTTQSATSPPRPSLSLWCLLLAPELGNLPNGNVRNVNWCLLSDMNYLTPAAVSARLFELNLTVAVINFQSSKFA